MEKAAEGSIRSHIQTFLQNGFKEAVRLVPWKTQKSRFHSSFGIWRVVFSLLRLGGMPCNTTSRSSEMENMRCPFWKCPFDFSFHWSDPRAIFESDPWQNSTKTLGRKTPALDQLVFERLQREFSVSLDHFSFQRSLGKISRKVVRLFKILRIRDYLYRGWNGSQGLISCRWMLSENLVWANVVHKWRWWVLPYGTRTRQHKHGCFCAITTGMVPWHLSAVYKCGAAALDGDPWLQPRSLHDHQGIVNLSSNTVAHVFLGKSWWNNH